EVACFFTRDCDVAHVGFFFFSSRRRHTRLVSDWSSDVCSSDLSIVSTLSERMPMSSAPRISSSRLPTPEKTILAGAMPAFQALRSEERRVGKEGRTWGGPEA